MLDLVYVAHAPDAPRLTVALESLARIQGPWRLRLVVPDVDVELFHAIAGEHEVVPEGQLDPLLPRLPRGWHKQQLVKLCLHRLLDRPALLLDADTLVARAFDVARFASSPLYVEDRHGRIHPEWVDAAAEVLDVQGGRLSIFPTPNFVHPAALASLHDWLTRRWGEPSVEGLARRAEAWTEWALYGQYCARVLRDAFPYPIVDADHVEGVWTLSDWSAFAPTPVGAPLLVVQSLLGVPVAALEERLRALDPVPRRTGPWTLLPTGARIRVRTDDDGFEGATTRDHLLLDTEKTSEGWRLGPRWGAWEGASLGVADPLPAPTPRRRLASTRRAVVTLAIGQAGRDWLAESRESLEGYANRIGADFLVLDMQRIGNGVPMFEKLQLGELLHTWDRALFLDADILVAPDCDDLFARVPPESVGAFVVSAVNDRHDASIARIQAALGVVPGWRRTYINTGVLVVSRAHAAMFDRARGAFTDHGEQTQLNYNLQSLGFPIHDIGWRYNHTRAVQADRFRSRIVHYAGDSHVEEGSDRAGQMRRDWERWRSSALSGKLPGHR